MRKKIILRLFLLIAFSISLYSCIHDDMSSATDPSKEYTNKSLWKEDEKYIRNVRKVFDRYADKNYFSGKYGNVLWDYALTMGTFDESFLEVPISRNDKIKSVLIAERRGDRVFFKIKNEKSSNDFFDVLVSKNRSQLKGNIISGNGDGISSKTTCYTVTVTWTWTSETTGEVIDSYVYTKTRCTSTGPVLTDPTASGDCLEEDCTGGGTGGGGSDGYPYTETPPNHPCAKLKAQNESTAYQGKIAELDKPSVLSQKKETGFMESKNGVFTNLLPAASTASSDGMTVQVTQDTKGYIHTHLNDYETGGINDDGLSIIHQPIRMFSPSDVNTLMTMAGFVTDGNYSDLYGTMVSSYGNYSIMFTGTAADIKTGFDTEQWRTDYKDYRKKNPYWSFEKLFLNFLKDKMNVKGVELYKIKDNGTIQKKTLNLNNNVQSNDCPQ